MIQSFKDPDANLIFLGGRSKKYPLVIQSTARRKLIQLDSAVNINDMRIPPGNHLEKLIGDRVGQWSVKINDQWRICFKWDDSQIGPYDVEIADYH